MKGRRIVTGLLVAALFLVSAVYAAVANPLAQTSSEPEGHTMAGAATGFIIGDAPDTNGYTGPVPEAQGPPVPSETALVEAPPDWESFFVEPQPDEDAGGSPGDIGSLEWSDFHYVFVAGSAFRPRASTTTWSYSGLGCVSVGSGNELFTAPLHLPEGSRIDYLRLYYRDTSASNSIAWITNYDAAGAFTDLTTASSADAVGYGTALSPYVGHVVDNASRSYSINWQANQTGTSMQLCGLRVAYRLP
jgi:hypothetical protein